jgi:uncharacterized protein YndB with AHSA1/START domain
MIETSVIHGTFEIERSYLATPSRVFAAFSSPEAKRIWYDNNDVDDEATRHDLDFRVGGRERFVFQSQDLAYRYSALYYDIVPGQRIIYSYEMYANDARISVSVTTIELAKQGDGTVLAWTEQGTYLDGFDGPDAPRLREEGTAVLLDGLTSYLDARAR